MSQLYSIGHVWMNEILSEDDEDEAALDCPLFSSWAITSEEPR